jgi:anti-sigma regulatory factor (Ser/Thr protein kinase)
VPEASVTLPSDPSSVPAARHFVVATLEEWGYGDAAWAAAQIVSELAGNCALHARTEFDVRLVQQAGGLRLEVHDSSAARVQQRHYSESSTTGRGLRLVDSLSRSWGVDVADPGKTVWVALHAAAEAGDTQDLNADLDLDALLEVFGDDDLDQPATRATGDAWAVAA